MFEPQMRHDKGYKELKGRWGPFEVQDAKRDLSLFVRAEDIQNAKRGDPLVCALAVCTLRTIGSKRAAFFRNVAYVELPDEKGEMHIYRFIYHPLTREYVRDFDVGEGFAMQ